MTGLFCDGFWCEWRPYVIGSFCDGSFSEEPYVEAPILDHKLTQTQGQIQIHFVGGCGEFFYFRQRFT